MSHFDIFYFDNNIDSDNPHDPRRILTPDADPILTMVSEWHAGEKIIQCCDEKYVQAIVKVGALRWENGDLRFDTPVFLQEDAELLNGLFACEARRLAGMLAAHRDELYAIVRNIDNGFDAATNLYHIICGMTLDGAFFDDLCEAGAVAVSRPHLSGMDYLTIIYQKCDELDRLSRRLLCSWNRLIGEQCTLQSFGDADGSRHDFYRSYRLQASTREDGQCPEYALLPPKEELLSETCRLIDNGECAPCIRNLLENYGYAHKGRICVPVFRKQDEIVVKDIAHIVSKCLLEPVTDLLLHCDLDITAVRHGVDRRELGNELYHILFGQINEALVEKGLVAAPAYFPGEGRYLKSIQRF